MDSHLLAYLAGIIDADGTIGRPAEFGAEMERLCVIAHELNTVGV